MPEQLAITDAMPTQAINHINGIARRRLLLAMPAVGFAGLAGLLFAGLGRDAGRLPSTLIGQAAPKFSLPAVGGRRLGLANTDLLGEVSLVNVFASWCVACRAEHPLLLQLAHDKTVPVHGIDYKDAPEDAARWLNTMGDPYTRTGADRDGRVAIDWGVYGVPETFVVGADGIVAAKQIGPLTEGALEETILPLVARLRREAERRQS
jgi:cytochrome c biogenesis protein CcmG, thiol:disulfide interchange protein DsbE